MAERAGKTRGGSDSVMHVCKSCHDRKYQGVGGSHFPSRWFMRCEECGRMIRPGKTVYVV